ncbi:IclR family transcriptional regulator [Pacificimonas sp. ICDLI1SI03]
MRKALSEAGGTSRRVQSIEVGFRILRVLRMSSGPLPLREIASRSGMPPSKVHLYLVSFVREKVVYQEADTGHYGLGSFAIQLGLAAIRQLDVGELASGVLSDLRDRTKCAIYLSLWGDRGPCIVAKADGALQGAFAVRLGYILPLTTTATGLIFLAHLPKAETEGALAAQVGYEGGRGAGKPVGKRDLAKVLAKARKDGYASTVGMLHRNFSGISVPIFDYNEQIAATLTLLGPAEFMLDDKQQELLSLLSAAAAEVSQRLGAPGELPSEGAA